MSVKRESTVHNHKITWTLQKKRIYHLFRIYHLSLHRRQSRGSGGLGPTNKNLGGGGHVLVPKMFLPMYLTLPVTSATSECIFCPQTTQELPNKHHEAGLPEQAWTTAYCQMHCPKSMTAHAHDWEEDKPPSTPPPTPSRFKTLRCLSFFYNVQWHISQRNFWLTPHNFPRTTNKIQRHFTEVRPQVSTNQPYKRVV